jgi:hypothetical protein
MVVIGTALGGGVLLYKMGNLMRAKPRNTSQYQLQKGGHNSDTVESRPTHVRTAHIAVCATALAAFVLQKAICCTLAC